MIINSNLTTNFTKKLGISLTAGALLFSAPAVGSNSLEKTRQQDTFEYCEKPSVPPSGTDSISVLRNAPSPKVKIEGKMKNAVIVVDVSQNVLYHYDEFGKPKIITDPVFDRKEFTHKLEREFEEFMDKQQADISKGNFEGYEYLYKEKLHWWRQIESKLKSIGIKNNEE